MATTQNVLGSDRAGLVGINLTTARLLARALARTGDELAEAAGRARWAAHEAGLSALAAGRLTIVARWADDEARALLVLIERLERIDGGPVRWRGGTDPDFAHPFRSVGWGESILAAVTAGDLGEAARLLGAHADDAVVATVLVGGLGVSGILQLLRLGQAEWDRTDDVGDDQRRVVAKLGGALALAQRQGTTTIGIDDLATGADDVDLPRSALALLFVGGARFSTASLRAAVAAVVTPLNHLVLAQPGLGVGPFLIPSRGGPVDARVVVLDAVADDRMAAVQAVGSSDLDDLLPGAAGYLDGGVALARVLVAATTPVDRFGDVVDGPLTTLSPVDVGAAGVNAHRVIEWIGRHRDTPLAVQAELGRLATPWIGSFRSPGLDAVVRQHLALDEDLARAYLVYGQARDGVAEDLQEAAWGWAAAELDHLSGPRFDGRGFDAVGSVVGIVTTTGLDAEVERAAAEDERIRRQNQLWQRTVRLVVQRIPSPARPVASALARQTLDRLLPVDDRELQLWREDRDVAVLHEYLALDHLAASTLWARRADNHYLRHVPTRLLVDPADPDLGLRNPLTFDAADLQAWTEWRSRLAAGGPAPLQVAGDQFLADGRG
jgi:hypothetical protein